MTWTPPRTWVTDEVVTAAMFNAQVRDNLNVIKTTRDSAGRISELSAATVADLSPENLTGLATRTGDSTYTAGRTRFTGSARLVIPVGADKWSGTKGVDAKGSAWIEGDYLHVVGQDEVERQWLGTFVSTPPGALPGSVWVEGDFLHYIDEDGDERRCQSAGITGHSDAAAVGGPVWVENFAHWIRETGTQEEPGHSDVLHADGTPHSDVPHDDTPHVNEHGDQGYSDFHANTHADEHTNTHTDSPHDDTYWDHSDHADHWDVPLHEDVTYGPHEDTHDDTPHVNEHGDDYSDGTSHNDHTDTPHVNTHDDTAHDDDPHTDHTDHTDTPHRGPADGSPMNVEAGRLGAGRGPAGGRAGGRIARHTVWQPARRDGSDAHVRYQPTSGRSSGRRPRPSEKPEQPLRNLV